MHLKGINSLLHAFQTGKRRRKEKPENVRLNKTRLSRCTTAESSVSERFSSAKVSLDQRRCSSTPLFPVICYSMAALSSLLFHQRLVQAKCSDLVARHPGC